MKRNLFRALGMAIGLAFVLGTLELGLRIVDWPSPGLYRNGRGPLALSMPGRDGSSWRLYPGPARLRHWDYDVEIVLNRHGFVEREPSPKAPGVWRIGVFGDSFAAGMGVAPTARFTQIWIEALAERAGDRPIEVYNFGSAWSGSAQNAAFLAAHGADYELDEVVLAVFGGNELDDNIRYADYLALSPEAQARADREASSGRSLRDWIRNHSRAAGFLFVTVVGRLSSKAAAIPDAAGLGERWPTTERALAEFAAAAGERPFSLWYLPDTHEWDDTVWQSISAELALDDADRHVVRDATLAWARDRDVPTVDATTILAGRSAAELRFRRDGHWNEAGHRVIGEALAANPEASRLQRGP